MMITDETLYRRYVNGDDEGLSGLMERYGDSLTFYISNLMPLGNAERCQVAAIICRFYKLFA